MLARHTLVWPAAGSGWQVVSPGAEARLRAWFEAGHPAIVARQDLAEAPGWLRLGVPLPPAEHKQRLALRLPRAQVARQTAPPLLAEVVDAAPLAWGPALRALQRAAGQAGFAPRVHGSFAWQALTGLAYVHAGSDLDLGWELRHAAEAEAVCALLLRWEYRHGLRADGELQSAAGDAVNWREYASGAARVLVKASHGCRLLARAALFAQRSAA